MRSTSGSRSAAPALALLILAAACGGGTTASPDAQRTRGLEIVNQVGKRIADAQSFTFNTHRTGDRVKRSGEKETVTVDEVVRIRRPDRMYMKMTGDLDLEAFFDGKQLTLMTPSAKVYGVVPAEGDINDLVNDVVYRYDIPFPLGDMVAFTSAERLVNEDTTGGYVGDEMIDGRETSKVSWQHPNLDWTLWASKDAEPIPVRLALTYKARPGQPQRTFEFSDWQFGVDLADAAFTAQVPDDYEGIAVLQRASAVITEDTPAEPPTPAPSGKE